MSDIYKTVIPRNKRALTTLGKAGVWTAVFAVTFATTYMSAKAIFNSKECGKSGCYQGYCYSYCGLSNYSGDWCYTTKTYSQSFAYVKCSSNSECNGCWKCAGSCTLG